MKAELTCKFMQLISYSISKFDLQICSDILYKFCTEYKKQSYQFLTGTKDFLTLGFEKKNLILFAYVEDIMHKH